jgi:hypothetical protein
LVDYPLEQRPGRYSYSSPDPRCTCGIVQNGYSSQGFAFAPSTYTTTWTTKTSLASLALAAAWAT